MTNSISRSKVPEQDVAQALADRLIKALPAGTNVSVELLTEAYRSVLRGATCARLTEEELEALLGEGFQKVLAAAAKDSHGAESPLVIANDIDGAVTKSLIYLRAMDEAEEELRDMIMEVCQPREIPWPYDLAAPYLKFLALDQGKSRGKLPALEKLSRRRFVVLTGGPGTGKTYALKAFLWLALGAGKIEPGRIQLMAPTNRAARVMSEVVDKTIVQAGVVDQRFAELLRGIPRATTIHRMLGERDALKKAELVVVDEASMVDLNLFRKLLEGIDRSKATLLIIGDPNQLPSVDIGSVLLDISNPKVGFFESTVARLHGSERSNPEIVEVAEAVNEGKFEVLEAHGHRHELELVKVVAEATSEAGPFIKIRELSSVRQEGWETKALALTKGLKVLCSHRSGPQGSVALSEKVMKKLGLSSADDDGAIIMVTRNDPAQGVVNGEIGVVADGRAYFSAGEDEFRSLALSELPDYELAYASTIHKAQGGEYDRVIIVIGKSEQEAFLSRELLYTAITRAKTSYDVYGSKDAINALKPVKRASGLAARLR